MFIQISHNSQATTKLNKQIYINFIKYGAPLKYLHTNYFYTISHKAMAFKHVLKGTVVERECDKTDKLLRPPKYIHNPNHVNWDRKRTYLPP